MPLCQSQMPTRGIGRCHWMNQATYCVRLLHHMDDIAQLEDHLAYHPCHKYLVSDWTKRFIEGSMDDFLIYGKNTDKHDERMNKFLNRMSEE